jgi:hypothetical protein
MVEVVKRSFFAIGIAALALLLVVGFTSSPAVTHGQETDVDVGSEPAGGSSPSAGTTTAPETSLPPQAPVDSPSASADGTASSLPSAGSGGYLNAGDNSTATVALAGLALLTLGSALGVYSLRSVRK